jgi:hypothetical protein
VGYLGRLTKTGAVDANNPVLAGGYAVPFDPADIGIRVACEVYHIAVTGPAGSTFQIWLDTTFYDNVARGDINSWDPAQPMSVTPGTTIYFYYNMGVGTVPKVTLFFREPSPI